MSARQSERVSLIDEADGPRRTTATLVASLAARLAVLHFVSAADAVGAIVAGFAALGREVSPTAQGARLRKAIEAGRAGASGNLLWKTLGIGEWASEMAPAPLLDQMRNDLALLLADDLEATLEMLPIPNQIAGTQGSQSPAQSTFVDCVLGLFVFSQEIVRAVEALAAPTITPPGALASTARPSAEPESHLLR